MTKSFPKLNYQKQMTELIIKYKDGSGDITERRISDVRLENAEVIDAFCHLRNARRSFKISNIIFATDAATGHVIKNPWAEFGLSKVSNGRERLESLTISILPAIKALKHFSMQIRGFAKRERAHLLDFIKNNIDVSQYSDDELDQWLYKLWIGDIYAYHDGDHSEYEELLREIPDFLAVQTHDIAIKIARGSGRKKIPQEIIEKINCDFVK